MKNQKKSQLHLSQEQLTFIDNALDGHNILVDACIGSGKTTSIQQLCNMIDRSKSILYLTFNKLLKLEAKAKIKNSNATVTNYHGFVYPYLIRSGIRTSVENSIKEFVKNDLRVKKFDVLIIDEYQDINDVTSQLLELIKRQNPNIQIIMVGDMKQKLYDMTTLDIMKWSQEFLGEHVKVDFTQCFRLSGGHAKKLGEAWDKKIIGVNNEQTISYVSFDTAVEMISKLEPHQTLVLGQNNGSRAHALNDLAERFPHKFNKKTVYSSSRDQDTKIDPDENTYIFTTFDTSKGMEREYCFVFDYTESYMDLRKSMPDSDPDIINNLFLVAASRGKKEIIFVTSPRTKRLPSMAELAGKIGFVDISHFDEKVEKKKLNAYIASDMFDFKYVEHVDACVDMLDVKLIHIEDRSVIDIKTNDYKLDISSAVGMYASASYFKDLNVKGMIENYLTLKAVDPRDISKAKETLYWQLENRYDNGLYNSLQLRPQQYSLPTVKGKYQTNFKHDEHDIQWQLLCYLAVTSEDRRYIREIVDRYVTKEQSKMLRDRMSTLLSRNDLHEIMHQMCEDASIVGKDNRILIAGQYDVLHDDIVYELKFTSAIANTHLLQCAVYLLLTQREVGRVWNLRTNELVEIRIKDREEFLDRVVRCITRGRRDGWNK